jgi:predicted Fe-Mo cluster-binding NifX family protein
VRVAIPTFGQDVSPRFCYAREVVVVEMEDGREVGRSMLALGELSYPSRLQVLENRGVNLLVCGGFNGAFLPDAERTGIHVVWGVSGPVDQAVRDVLAGKIGAARHHPNCWCQEARAGGRTHSTSDGGHRPRRSKNP